MFMQLGLSFYEIDFNAVQRYVFYLTFPNLF